MKNIQLSNADLDSLKKIGKLFKNRREEISCTLERAADITRISIHILIALEKGNHKEFPSLVFLRGFVRSYAKFLEIDDQEIIEEVNRIFSSDEEKENARIASSFGLKEAGGLSQPVYTAMPNLVGNMNKMKLLIGGAFFALVAVGFFLVSSLRTDKSGNAPTQNEVASSKATESPTSSGNSSAQFTLEAQALNRGWVRVTLDDKPQQEIPVSSGQNFVWKADQKIAVVFSRGDLFKLHWNGQEYLIAESQKNFLTELNFPKTMPSP